MVPSQLKCQPPYYGNVDKNWHNCIEISTY